jgi:DNA-binding transcriptional regulator GbsR (MarR family)
MNLYQKAHLVVAAIRVLQFIRNHEPTAEEIGEFLSISREETGWIVRRLEELGIIEMVSAGDLHRLFLRDFLKIETIPNEITQSRIDQELENFKQGRKELTEKVESFQAAQTQKKKDLFADLEKKLRMSLPKNGPVPS